MADRPDGNDWRKTALGSFSGAVVTIAGMIGYFQVNPPRADPFTGQQANQLRLEIKSDIHKENQELMAQITRLERRIGLFEDNLSVRVSELERQLHAVQIRLDLPAGP